jgi:hypothetical protein
VRRLYPPLIVVLVIVVVVGLVNRGGGGSSKTSEQSVSAPSVFPTPSTVPTPAPPPVAGPTPTTQQQPIAPQPKACRALRVSGRAVSVTILQGQVTCRSARAVVRAFKSGKGRRRGRYLTVRGWRCDPSGTCIRGGKSIKAS